MRKRVIIFVLFVSVYLWSEFCDPVFCMYEKIDMKEEVKFWEHQARVMHFILQ